MWPAAFVVDSVYCCHLQDFAAPREIIWLNGAPGSGKVRASLVCLGSCISIRGLHKGPGKGCLAAALAAAPPVNAFH
jgi:hypothetical protein